MGIGGILSELGSLGADVGGALGTAGSDIWGELSNIGLPSTSGQGAGWNWGTLIPAGLLGAGFIGNYQQQSRVNALNNLLSNPAALAHFIQSMSHPLAAGAVASARNAAQASLGERGLSQSPAQSAAVYAQALAPLYAQQQSEAEQAAMNALGTREYLLSGQRPANLAGPLAALMQRFNRSADPTDPSQDPNAGPPTLPIPGLDPTSNVWPAGSPYPIWNPANTLNPGFEQPDWGSIFGVPSTPAPNYAFQNLPPALSVGFGGE